MAENPAKSRSGSLKSKVRLLMTALAFSVALCGLVSFGVIHFFGVSFYAVFLPFVFLSAAIIFFGNWLSKEIVYPVEKVSLLAKSYERGVSTSLPKTSGSMETDELAQTIARLGGQIEKLVSSMDEVAGGNLKVALSPNTTSDRISQTFQKLLAKVSESIHAKQELEKLQKAVSQLSDEIASVRYGNLNVKIKTETAEIREISETLIYLTEELTEFIRHVKSNGAQAQNLAAETKKTILEVALLDENRVQKLNQALTKLKQVPDMVQRVFEELSQSASSGSQSLEKARPGIEAAQENSSAIGSLRRQIQEAVKQIQRLDERSQEIGKVAKTVEDLAQRTNLVALNASIQANEVNKGGRGFIVVSEEIERLATRAANAGKQIFAINKTVQAEINKAENMLLATVLETARLSKLAMESADALADMERYATGVLNLQNRVGANVNEQVGESKIAIQAFVQDVSETENSIVILRESAASAGKISAVLQDLQSLAADFKIPSAEKSQTVANFASPEANVSV